MPPQLPQQTTYFVHDVTSPYTVMVNAKRQSYWNANTEIRHIIDDDDGMVEHM